MKHLCFGALATVLCHCRANYCNKTEFVRKLLQIISELDMPDDRAVSALLRGERNLRKDISSKAKELISQSGGDALERCRQRLESCLDLNQKSIIILALQDIIRNDARIRSDVVVEVIGNITKQQFVDLKEFDFFKTILGILLYVVAIPKNEGNKDGIKEITKDYLDSFEPESDSISFPELGEQSNELKELKKRELCS